VQFLRKRFESASETFWKGFDNFERLWKGFGTLWKENLWPSKDFRRFFRRLFDEPRDESGILFRTLFRNLSECVLKHFENVSEDFGKISTLRKSSEVLQKFFGRRFVVGLDKNGKVFQTIFQSSSEGFSNTFRKVIQKSVSKCIGKDFWKVSNTF
jgi:hypothetical protein